MAPSKTAFGPVVIASETVNEIQTNIEIEAGGIQCELRAFTVSAPEAVGLGHFQLKDSSGKVIASGTSSLTTDNASDFVRTWDGPYYPIANGLDIHTPVAPDTNVTWTAEYRIIVGSKAL